MKMNYLDLTTTDPDYNLAVEEFVFECLPKDRMYVMLWRNDNAIIIGKHQNTHAQINSAFVEEKGIRVVRRLSGGGAVYHDLGNLNFTIIADAEGTTLDFGRFCDMVIAALKKAGVDAQRNGRNDMTIDGKKFSGNAQYLRNGRVMHHGTILFDSDMSILSRALQVDPEKIKSKGVDSVRSRVTNVRPCLDRDMTMEEFRALLLQTILEQTPGEEYILTAEDLAEIESRRLARYATWDWNYGQSPQCTMEKRMRKEGCGSVEAYLTVNHGIIESITLLGDFFSATAVEELCDRLAGVALKEDALAAATEGFDAKQYIMGLSQGEFMKFLLQ